MDIERNFGQLVDPTIADLEANPTSVKDQCGAWSCR
jgi:hypothetical protein